ncbi:MAG: hypothetical protein ABL959_01165 [Pyrinomonadaceae bacterium]
MKIVSKKQALARLSIIRDGVANTIRNDHEHKAAPCATCLTPGACCLDAHFVNVRISRLEAVAINGILDALPVELSGVIRERIDETIEEYDLRSDREHENKFACPLFEKEIGCLVHDAAKPIPCIVHACYESAADLPPSSITENAELAIDRLNTQTYGRAQPLLPIPLALKVNHSV